MVDTGADPDFPYCPVLTAGVLHPPHVITWPSFETADGYRTRVLRARCPGLPGRGREPVGG